MTELPKTREELQIEAMILASILGTVTAMISDPDKRNQYDLIDMAYERAQRLNAALDSVENPQVAS